MQERIDDTNKLKEILDVKITLLTELDLKILCKNNGLNYNTLKIEWRSSENTYFNKSKGEYNAMYGKHHSEKTKKILSEKGKERMKDIDYRNKITRNLIKYCQATNYADAKKPRSKRIAKICPMCKNSFITTEASPKRYCCYDCYSKSDENIKLLENNTLNNINKRNKLNSIIKKFICNWAKQNRQVIQNTKYNNISTSLIDLQTLIEEKFNIKDWRVISKIACNSKSRKDFLSFLKQI